MAKEKEIVEFRKTHGRYVKGDVAGFDPAVIAKWPKGTCIPYDPDRPKPAEREAADLEADAQDLAARAAELQVREEELAAREAALAEREGEAIAEPATSAAEPSKDGDGAKAAGAPPKQGAKA